MNEPPAKSAPHARRRRYPGKNPRAFHEKYKELNPERVAACFAEDGSLRVNDGPDAVGRKAIADVARGFMTGFPDLVVTKDKVVPESKATAFHWTLTGTNTGPGGTGKRVRISGRELWQFDKSGLISRSQGLFDGKEYERQVNEGVDG